MAENSKIEWTHHTLNLWWGCQRVHQGCDNCYAAALSNRWGKDLWDNDKRQIIKNPFGKLDKWNKLARVNGERHRVFVGSMMDVFEKPMPVYSAKGESLGKTTSDLREEFFSRVDQYPNLIFLLLTKRPSNINKYIPSHWLVDAPENVMFGASVVDGKSSKNVASHLNRVKGKKFLSVEPLLEEIDLDWFIVGSTETESTWSFSIDWVIVGGESGPKRRPFDPQWARLILDDCRDANIPFFMKQWDKVKPIPGDLMIREFPKYHQFTTIS